MLISKTLAKLLVALVQNLFTNFQVFLHDGDSVASKEDAVKPDQEAHAGYYGNQDKPEPQEREYLFVEQIDWQDALYCVVLEKSENGAYYRNTDWLVGCIGV